MTSLNTRDYDFAKISRPAHFSLPILACLKAHGCWNRPCSRASLAIEDLHTTDLSTRLLAEDCTFVLTSQRLHVLHFAKK